MSNHFSADKLKFPGDDRRLDLTDLFVFQASAEHHQTLDRGHEGTTVLIMDSNPTSAPPPIPAPVTGPEFYPGAVYRINIDTDGDNHADIAFTFEFSEYQNGTQTGTARYATGAQARRPEPAGEVLAADIPVSFDGTARPVQAGRIRLFAGLRSDPFFADVEGALHGFVWTGHDDPNGRVPTDDVYIMRFAWQTNGKVPPAGLKPTMTCWPVFPTSVRPTPTSPGPTLSRQLPGLVPRRRPTVRCTSEKGQAHHVNINFGRSS